MDCSFFNWKYLFRCSFFAAQGEEVIDFALALFGEVAFDEDAGDGDANGDGDDDDDSGDTAAETEEELVGGDGVDVQQGEQQAVEEHARNHRDGGRDRE